MIMLQVLFRFYTIRNPAPVVY